MARPKAVIDATLAEKAEDALKALPDSKVCIRLKAIISSARYPISLVSSVFGTDRTTLWRWIKRFASKGIAGLADEPKGHKPPKLGAEQRQQVAIWLEEGRNNQGEPIFWTLQKLNLRRVRRWVREFAAALSMPEILNDLEVLLSQRRRS